MFRCLVLIAVSLALICVLLLVFIILQHITITSCKNTGWLFKSTEPKNWSESRQYCRDHGADLVIINSEQKQRFISSLTTEALWIGLSDTEVEGNMKWVDNSPLKQGFWVKANMAKVQVLNVAVLDNPSPFGNPFQFEITFECMEDLPEDLEWKIIYVGSAESEEYDQVLDSVLVGPVPAGRHMFVFQADAPNTGLIPESDAVGVTVVLITCTYRGQEFIRIGYYVNNEYTDPELRENPPVKPDYTQLQRNILASNPRVTRFHINWEATMDKMEDSENVDPAPNTMLPPTSMPGKAPPLGLMPDNSMDCL
ncbi:hypothetical protein QQF64_000461 [Cirrhinus molitorella]|uniref:C-type lectin domain-containing protein n=3 Tax=Cirrhinus TaxID=59897 RepID=A0ABR3NX91_9TELE